MKKFIFLLFATIVFSSCSVFNRVYVNDYGRKVQLLKDNFPEIYDLYRNGHVIIDDVYIYEQNGKERVGVNYRYR